MASVWPKGNKSLVCLAGPDNYGVTRRRAGTSRQDPGSPWQQEPSSALVFCFVAPDSAGDVGEMSTSRLNIWQETYTLGCSWAVFVNKPICQRKKKGEGKKKKKEEERKKCAHAFTKEKS